MATTLSVGAVLLPQHAGNAQAATTRALQALDLARNSRADRLSRVARSTILARAIPRSATCACSASTWSRSMARSFRISRHPGRGRAVRAHADRPRQELRYHHRGRMSWRREDGETAGEGRRVLHAGLFLRRAGVDQGRAGREAGCQISPFSRPAARRAPSARRRGCPLLRDGGQYSEHNRYWCPTGPLPIARDEPGFPSKACPHIAGDHDRRCSTRPRARARAVEQIDRPDRFYVNIGDLLTLAKIGKRCVASLGDHTERDATAGAALVEAEHKSRIFRRAAVMERIDAERTVRADQRRGGLLAELEAWSPHQRAIAEHPKLRLRIWWHVTLCHCPA